MRIHVVSLPARADRRSQFRAWNWRAGLEIDFINAVVGADLDRAVLGRDGVLDGDGAKFTAGALGNAMSHRAMWLKSARQRCAGRCLRG